MTDLRLEREFNVTPERLFEVVSTRAGLLQWWGTEETSIVDHELDFSRTGPWFSTMGAADGQQYKMSGQVTHFDPPKSVGFTWGWHDDADQRGLESHVTFTVAETASGSRLIIDHRQLDNDEQAGRHEMGWAATMRNLAKLLN